MKTLIKISPFLLLLLLIFKGVRSCTEDEIIYSDESYEIFQEPGVLFGSYRKAPQLKVLSDSGYFVIDLHRYYYGKPPLLIGDEIKYVEITEYENEDLKIKFSGNGISETKKFNVKQAQDSLKQEGLYKFEKYWTLHKKPITTNRAWIEWALATLVLGFLTYKSAQYFKNYMRKNGKNTNYQIAIIQFCIYIIGIALMIVSFLLIFSDVPNYLD